MCTKNYENECVSQGYQCVVGVDECGRGCLAGPVTVCACYIPPHVFIEGVNDSKKLSAKKRSVLYEKLTNHPDIKYSVVHIDSDTIDQINILQSTFRGMFLAVEGLKAIGTNVDLILIDGNQTPPQFKDTTPVRTIIGGDALVYCIGAASIIAKETRDRLMKTYDAIYPGYDFTSHKGYPSPKHKKAIAELGVLPIHRKTFNGVKSFNKNSL